MRGQNGKTCLKKLAYLVLATAIFFCSQAFGELVLEAPKGNVIVFSEITGQSKVNVMFADGCKIFLTYNPGVPLGPEKALLEPSIR